MSFPGIRFGPASNSFPRQGSPDWTPSLISLVPGRRLTLIGGDPYELDDDTGFGTSKGEQEFERRLRPGPARHGPRAS